MMSPKRGRACDSCHSIKIKCELGSGDGDPPCTRCTRLEKDCVTTPPVRQKERVAELEAKVEALTKLLKAQNLQVPAINLDQPSPGISLGRDTTTSPKESPEPKPRKRRRGAEILSPKSISIEFEQDPSPAIDEFFTLDPVLDHDLQVQMFEKYRDKMEPRFPLASLVAKSDYDTLRLKHPILLQAVIFAAGSKELSAEMQNKVTRITLYLFSPTTIEKMEPSMELVQAIIVVIFWYRSPGENFLIDWFQLVTIVTRLSDDLGLTGPNSTPPIFSFDGRQVISKDTFRTWASCYLLSNTLAIARRIPSSIPWKTDIDNQLYRFEYWRDGLSINRLLCQFIRASQICEQISIDTRLTDYEIVMNVSDPAAQSTMRRHGNMILDWKAQIPSSIKSAILKVWEHIPELYLHEAVLHTSTNKQSFAAPYIASRLSVTDFPATLVTEQHIVSLYALSDSSHRILDYFTNLDVETILYMPAILPTAQAQYAVWILIKLYIATTALGNTYGAFISAESLQMENYLDKVIELGRKVREVDSNCSTMKVLEASIRLKEWVGNYKANHLSLPMNQYMDTTSMAQENPMATSGEIDWTTIALSNEQIDFGTEDLFRGF